MDFWKVGENSAVDIYSELVFTGATAGYEENEDGEIIMGADRCISGDCSYLEFIKTL